MNYTEASQRKAELESAVASSSMVLQTFPKLPNGLTPDGVKALPAFSRAKDAYTVSAAQLRTFNAWFLKTFKREEKARRDALHKARCEAFNATI